MITFQVDDMTCRHCVGTITKAVKVADPDAAVRIDLSRRLVDIEPGGSDADGLREAIEAAGYAPVAATPSAASRPPARRGGCCCG